MQEQIRKLRAEVEEWKGWVLKYDPKATFGASIAETAPPDKQVKALTDQITNLKNRFDAAKKAVLAKKAKEEADAAAVRKAQEEEARRKVALEEAKRKAQEEEARRRSEQARRQAAEEARKKEEAAAKAKAEAEARAKADAQRKAAEEAEARRRQEEKAAHQREVEANKRRAAEEVERLAQAKREEQRRAEQEAAAQEEVRRKIADQTPVDTVAPDGEGWVELRPNGLYPGCRVALKAQHPRRRLRAGHPGTVIHILNEREVTVKFDKAGILPAICDADTLRILG